MANKTINDLVAQTAAAAGDFVPIWRASQADTVKITKANFIGATLTGAGTVATGGFTLTVPATGTAALLGTAQSFTKTQTIAPDTTGQTALDVNMPTDTAGFATRWLYNGAIRAHMIVAASTVQMALNAFNNGAGGGPSLVIDRNNDGSTPASGNLRVTNRAGTDYYIWVDASANVRIGTTEPTNAQDGSGTVIGTQTSMAAAKLISDDLSELGEVMARIRQGAAAVRRFTYRSGAFGREVFEGVVIDHAPAYGMDRDADRPAGKSLNIIQIVGDLLRTADWLMRRVEELERGR